MKIKTFDIKGCKTSDKVLLFISRDNDGNEAVNIIAWHVGIKDYEDLIQHEVIQFPNIMMMERYIIDFSEPSANEFTIQFQV